MQQQTFTNLLDLLKIVHLDKVFRVRISMKQVFELRFNKWLKRQRELKTTTKFESKVHIGITNQMLNANGQNLARMSTHVSSCQSAL